ncbi:MAG: ATP-binding protein, partial [Acidobacteriota bacterium]|nr:ATP-binding protein [Acidobacteriota bacterium]
LELITEVPEGIILFNSKRHFKQILMNLLSNAVKFTQQGSIKVSGRVLNDKTLEIKISDTGIGIRKEDLDKLFMPFHQINVPLKKNYEGTGLGLYLTKKLLGLLGGEIDVKSEYGRGTEFTFTLPLKYDKRENK